MAQVQRFVLGSVSTNCYVVSNEQKDCVVIDCEAGMKDIFQKQLEASGLKPQYIILTHGHDDHIGGVQALTQEYGCKVCAFENERTLLNDPALNLTQFSNSPLSIQPEIVLKNDEEFSAGALTFKVIHTPGHTQGSICLLLDDILFTGDTLFAGSCGRTDLPTGDWNNMQSSLKKLRQLNADYTVCPGHGPKSSLAYEKTGNPYLL